LHDEHMLRVICTCLEAGGFPVGISYVDVSMGFLVDKVCM